MYFFFFRAGEGVGDKVILSLSLFVAKRKRHAAHGVSKIKMTRQNNKAAVEIPRKCEHVILKTFQNRIDHRILHSINSEMGEKKINFCVIFVK